MDKFTPDIIRHVTIDELMTAPASSWGRRQGAEQWRFQDEWNNDPEACRKALSEGRAWPATLEAYKVAAAESCWTEDVPVFRNARRARVWDDIHGAEADVGRALVAVSPWMQYTRTASRRAVTIGVCLAMSSGNSGEEFRSNIINAVCLCDALTKAGYDVRIVGASIAQGGGWHPPEWADGINPNWFGVVFPFKDFGAPLDQELMLAIGTPGFFRHFLLNAYGYLFPAMTKPGGFGRATKAPDTYVQDCGIDVMVARQWDTDDSQENWIQRTYASLKEKLEGVAV